MAGIVKANKKNYKIFLGTITILVFTSLAIS
jgi:hypothetical protein